MGRPEVGPKWAGQGLETGRSEAERGAWESSVSQPWRRSHNGKNYQAMSKLIQIYGARISGREGGISRCQKRHRFVCVNLTRRQSE
jgi:hypothetical protein